MLSLLSSVGFCLGWSVGVGYLFEVATWRDCVPDKRRGVIADRATDESQTAEAKPRNQRHQEVWMGGVSLAIILMIQDRSTNL